MIQLDPSSINSGFAIKACVDRGEFVALLGDRIGIGDERRTGRREFLGAGRFSRTARSSSRAC